MKRIQNKEEILSGKKTSGKYGKMGQATLFKWPANISATA
jgi:hypothetical protein